MQSLSTALRAFELRAPRLRDHHCAVRRDPCLLRSPTRVDENQEEIAGRCLHRCLIWQQRTRQSVFLTAAENLPSLDSQWSASETAQSSLKATCIKNCCSKAPQYNPLYRNIAKRFSNLELRTCSCQSALVDQRICQDEHGSQRDSLTDGG